MCFPGIFYRGGAEQKIRKYLVEGDHIDTVIALPPNLFYGTSIEVNILVLAKNKNSTETQFIDASGEDFFRKETNNNVLTDEHIDRILSIFEARTDVPHVACTVDKRRIAENGYNLSVSSYVEPANTREVIDITALNAEITQTVARIDTLRTEIDAIIQEIEL